MGANLNRIASDLANKLMAVLPDGDEKRKLDYLMSHLSGEREFEEIAEMARHHGILAYAIIFD